MPFAIRVRTQSFLGYRELNVDPKLAGEKHLMNLTSLDEWRSEAYESAKMLKEKVKKWHDRRILKGEFNIGDKVLLFRSRFRFSPVNYFPDGKDLFISKKYIGLVQSRLIISKAPNLNL